MSAAPRRAAAPNAPDPDAGVREVRAAGNGSVPRLTVERDRLQAALLARTIELARSTRQMDSILAALPDATLRVDGEGTVLAAFGPPESEVFRVRPAERLIGCRLQDIPLPGLGPRFAAGLRALRDGATRTAFEFAAPRGDATLTFEARLVPLDGGEVLLHLRDVTGARRTESALRASEEHRRRLFEAHPSPMWLCDPESLRLLEVNEAAVRHYGWTRDELLRMALPDLVSPADVAAWRQAIARAGTGQRSAGTFRHRRRDGTGFEVEVTARRLSRNGRGVVLVLATDLTERRRLEAELRHAQKMEAIGQLVGGIAHDFNNLLTSIIGYSEILSRCAEGREPDHEYASQILRSSQSAATLTGQLLAFSRRAEGRPRAVEIAPLVEDYRPLLARLLGESIRIVTRPTEREARVLADPNQLEQVILNLAANARDAMPRGGTLELETHTAVRGRPRTSGSGGAPEPWVVLTVRDTGCGMSAETLAHAFEPFFTTKEIGKGTGLGLPSVEDIVRQHGGFVTVDTAPGAGCAVHVHLPPLTGPAPEGEPAEPGPARLDGSETLLLVEDDEAVRTLEREILAATGYTVLAAASAFEALALEQQHAGPIHLLIADVILPGQNGPALAGALLARRPGTRVLFVSGYAEDPLEAEAALEGAGFLRKPFTPEALLRRVGEILSTPGAHDRRAGVDAPARPH